MAQITIDPVNRIEGHQKWWVHITGPTPGVTDNARVYGMMFRGFERILVDRDPRDNIIICGRI